MGHLSNRIEIMLENLDQLFVENNTCLPDCDKGLNEQALFNRISKYSTLYDGRSHILEIDLKN
jgi:hypothetical protein